MSMKYIHTANCPAANGRGTCHCMRSRGYMMKGELRPGDMVTVFEGFTVARTIKGMQYVLRSGDVAKLEDFDNLGFGGIVANLRYEGVRLNHVDAGSIIKADNGESYRRAVMEEYDRRIQSAHAAVDYARRWAVEYGLPLDAIGTKV